jgi:hypothetical protein
MLNINTSKVENLNRWEHFVLSGIKIPCPYRDTVEPHHCTPFRWESILNGIFFTRNQHICKSEKSSA